MRLFHGTSIKSLLGMICWGITAMDRFDAIPEEWGKTVCVYDSLEKAKGVASYFGPDGVVLELDIIDESLIHFHPDYGCDPEFDTIHIAGDVSFDDVIDLVAAPDYNREEIRPAGMPLREWKESLQ